MTQLRRVCGIVFSLILVAFVFPLLTYANSPPPMPRFVFELLHTPEEAVYMDLLIRMDETDPRYSELEEDNLPNSFSESAEIITYCKDGFISYTFHYRGAISQIRLNEKSEVVFFIDSTRRIYSGDTIIAEDHKQDIENRGEIRLALLDAQGNIVKISRPLSIRPSGLFSYSLGTFHYDASADSLEVDSESNLGAILVFLIVGIGGITLTCFTEWLVALSFDGVRKYSRLTVIVNIVSQLIMRVGQMFLLKVMYVFDIVLVYLGMILLLEIMVYLCEFLLYRRLMKDVSWKRCLAYTVCANTASLISGLLLLSIVLF